MGIYIMYLFIHSLFNYVENSSDQIVLTEIWVKDNIPPIVTWSA